MKQKNPTTAVVGLSVAASIAAIVTFVTGGNLPDLLATEENPQIAKPSPSWAEAPVPSSLPITPTASVLPTQELTTPRPRASTPQPDAAPSPLSRGRAQVALPQQFQGAWFGNVTQGGSASSPYPVQLTIVSGRVGDRIASPVYSTLKCRVTWTLLAAWENELQVDERVESGSCYRVKISLTMQSDGSMLYVFEAGNGLATLHREN